MSGLPLALLIHDRRDPFLRLESALKGLSVDTLSVRSDAFTENLIDRYRPPLMFVDVPVWNRSRANIIKAAWKADLAPNVIIVGSEPDVELYVSAIERGAFSFVAPPFEADRLMNEVHSAVKDVRDRKQAMDFAAAQSCPT
jgi:DNA-binding NtrC family response regulator